MGDEPVTVGPGAEPPPPEGLDTIHDVSRASDGEQKVTYLDCVGAELSPVKPTIGTRTFSAAVCPKGENWLVGGPCHPGEYKLFTEVEAKSCSALN